MLQNSLLYHIVRTFHSFHNSQLMSPVVPSHIKIYCHTTAHVISVISWMRGSLSHFSLPSSLLKRHIIPGDPFNSLFQTLEMGETKLHQNWGSIWISSRKLRCLHEFKQSKSTGREFKFCRQHCVKHTCTSQGSETRALQLQEQRPLAYSISR